LLLGSLLCPKLLLGRLLLRSLLFPCLLLLKLLLLLSFERFFLGLLLTKGFLLAKLRLLLLLELQLLLTHLFRLCTSLLLPEQLFPKKRELSLRN
jgi:hypothetical protein